VRRATSCNCDRRAGYLDCTDGSAGVRPAVDDDQWADSEAGTTRCQLLAMPGAEVMQKMLFGMGSLSLGELAVKRMKVALRSQTPLKDEHDASATTRTTRISTMPKGIQNVYLASTSSRWRADNGPFAVGAALVRAIRSWTGIWRAELDRPQ